MKVLVTGATGMVGRALVAALLARAQRVRVALHRPWGAYPQPPDWAAQVESVVVGDLGAHTDWRAAVLGADAVVHLAARVHQMRETAANPLALYRDCNTAASIELARIARQSGVVRYIFMSSVKVLGEQTAPGLAFDAHSPAQPLDPYGQSKWEAEQGLQRLAQDSGLECVVLRPPLVYGPGVQGNFAALWRAVARGWPLPLGALTHNRRSLVGVDNLVSAILTTLSHPQAAGQTLLVSDGTPVSTAALVEAMALAQGRPAHLWPVPVAWLQMLGHTLGRGAAVSRLCGDLVVNDAVLRQSLAWTPPLCLAQGLRQLAISQGLWHETFA